MTTLVSEGTVPVEDTSDDSKPSREPRQVPNWVPVVAAVVSAIGALGTLTVAIAAWSTLSSTEEDKEIAARFETVSSELRSINENLVQIRSSMDKRLLRLESLHLSDGDDPSENVSPVATAPAPADAVAHLSYERAAESSPLSSMSSR